MKTSRLLICIHLAICSLGFFSVKVNAMIPHMDFDEVAFTADIIFVGTLTDKSCRMNRKGNMIFTDVTFGDLEIFKALPDVQQQIDETLVLAYAGGKLGSLIIDLSDMPKLAIGKRYIIFSRYDGRNYLNPFIGGDQGIFSLIKDDETGEEYPIGIYRSGIVSVQNGKLKRAPGIRRVTNGIPIEALGAKPMMASPNSAKGASKEMKPSTKSRLRTPPEKILSKYEFIIETLKVLDTPRPVKETSRGNHGKSEKQNQFGKLHNNKPSAKSKSGKVPVSTILSKVARQQQAVNGAGTIISPTDSGSEGAAAAANPPGAGDNLCWCGSYDLPLVMEQVSQSWWTWSQNNDSMAMYNNSN